MTTPVFDGHNDTITRHPGDIVAGGGPGHVDLPAMRAGGMRGGVFAVFVPSEGESAPLQEIAPGVHRRPFDAPVAQPEAAASATAAAGRLNALEAAGHLVLARDITDLDRAFTDLAGPPVAVLHLEGAEPIDRGLEALDFWYAAGLRSLGPVWSRPNDFAEGVPFIFGSGPDTGPGLTPAGRSLITRCAELGILVDLAHLNEAGFWDIARMDVGPLVSSHTGAAGVALTSRGLTDPQLDAVAASGGLVGIVYAVYFVDPQFRESPDVGLEAIVRHARYVADRIGVEHVGLGSDFDGTTIPADLGSAAGLPRLLEALGDAGFTQEEVELIAWRNWRRVLEAWWR